MTHIPFDRSINVKMNKLLNKIIQILFCKRGYDVEPIFDHTLTRRGAILDQTSKVALGRCGLQMLAQHINAILELYFPKSDDPVKQTAMHIKKNPQSKCSRISFLKIFLVSSADNLYKKCGPRSGPIERRF